MVPIDETQEDGPTLKSAPSWPVTERQPLLFGDVDPPESVTRQIVLDQRFFRTLAFAMLAGFLGGVAGALLGQVWP